MDEEAQEETYSDVEVILDELERIIQDGTIDNKVRMDATTVQELIGRDLCYYWEKQRTLKYIRSIKRQYNSIILSLYKRF